ncbi:peroxisomal (S)-2-hydroxy-acid oxidase GLO3 [Folsomia candida]|uniref:peroxisomal (S)-2-hydroxy-acid oxidase GLO3 n=1 Tax=Folsomia candida TaxID=158441 RepID=UPI000B8FB953|nr:peroxisomal (S)-2-hydroxy-acid oxidase GLO3 [Folsomia candida]
MDKLVCVPDFEKEAHKLLDNNSLQYYKSGADDEITLQENKNAFKRWLIKPRMLRDVSNRTTKTMVLGKPVAFPLGLSPTAMQRLAHPNGECANAQAAASMGTIFILSTIATSSIEEVAGAAPNGRKWYQLYVYKDRSLSLSMIQRAEKCGFEAIVLTVDAPYFGKRRSNIRDAFKLPPNLRLANFQESSKHSDAMSGKIGSAFAYHDTLLDQSLTWKDVKWLKSVTKLPIIVKGIMTSEDAELACSFGVAGVFVSNHGARQIDTVNPTIDVLPEIVKQVKGRCEIYLDGGVTTGGDVFKAIALGANMVFAGRPFLWGLTVGGEAGAQKILQIFKDELDLMMALTGVSSMSELTSDFVTKDWKSHL